MENNRGRSGDEFKAPKAFPEKTAIKTEAAKTASLSSVSK